jgi:hypothetical protein
MNTCCILPCYSSYKERWLYTQLENRILFLMLYILYSSLLFWECDICFIYFYCYYLRTNCIVLTSWRCQNTVLIGNGELVLRVFETVKSLIDSSILQIQDSSNAKQTYFYLDLIKGLKWHKLKCREICIDDAINISYVDNWIKLRLSSLRHRRT